MGRDLLNDIDNLKYLQSQARDSRELCMSDKTLIKRTEKIALANIVIDFYDTLIQACINEDESQIEYLNKEREAIAFVAAEILLEK